MKLRAAALLFTSVLGLLVVGIWLCFQLLGAGLSAAQQVTEQRLSAIGVTSVYALGLLAKGQESALLDNLARSNQLEAAYLLESSAGGLRIVPRPGLPMISLLRVDVDKALQALDGQLAVGVAYSLESTDEKSASDGSRQILAGYFPVLRADGTRQVLVLEAGGSFSEAPARLRRTAWAVCAVAAQLAGLCILLLLGAQRTALRERQLHVQAERGQTTRQLAAMVAHEIRNPLGTLRAGVELLREQSADPELVADMLSEIERLRSLTTEFITLSRDAPLRVAPLDLVVLCKEVCARVQREYPTDLLTVHLVGASSAVISGDADRLTQVLLNLMQNGIQAMLGQGELTIAVQPERRGVRLLLSDSGPGVSEQLSRRLFAPFASSKEGGSGLGLVISRRIIERHGGTLTLLARSPATAGTAPGACFALFLPNTPPKAAAAEDLGEGERLETDSALR